MKKALMLLLALITVLSSCKKSNQSLETALSKKSTKAEYSTLPPFPSPEAEKLATGTGKSKQRLQSTWTCDYLFENYFPPHNSYNLTIYPKRTEMSNWYLIDANTHALVQKFRTPWQVTVTMEPGTYQIYCGTLTYGYHSNDFNGPAECLSRPFTIKAKPTDPPNGYLNLYRYYNPNISRHYYSTDWNLTGSIGYNYELEKVQGLLFANPGTGLVALHEYYNSSIDDHWYTTNPNGYPGYVDNRIIGYIPTSSTSQATQELKEYFGQDAGHVYVSPPELQGDVNWTFLQSVGFLIPPASLPFPQPIYSFYNATNKDHHLSSDINATTSYPGWANEGVAFKAYANQQPGTVPVYEFYDNYYKDHYDSTNINAVTGYPNWVSQGIAFYAYPNQISGTIPVYLYYHSGNHDHYLSTGGNPGTGWATYGIAFYAFPQ